MSGLKLKLDNFVKRENDRSARNIPVKPLTKEQKDALSIRVWPNCRNAYISRMKRSHLYSDFEEIADLENDAYIAMWNILEKFDLSKCGEISDYDVPGATNPKTLDFYFKNYFSGRVNFIACEARAQKKSRGVGPAENLDEVAYDPEDNGSQFSEYLHKYEITGDLLEELKKKDVTFQRFFRQLYQLQFTQRELREEYKEKFNIYKGQSNDFINYLSKKYKLDSHAKKMKAMFAPDLLEEDGDDDDY